ncbi:hypothetical protein C9374_004317 [Naegleria lovaniensis]|uniref:Uncharacterized protein n=1 Tax=Naegleria lovaniensis TaxID=51637 RepID=A0AA88KPE2_NAELO|nr:uncharacterized protein C9374_004317 [Naegleria lovaniensis]KAG2383646.1 hypothetical protein C9374_004317 [Naegleria lovaniensis]
MLLLDLFSHSIYCKDPLATSTISSSSSATIDVFHSCHNPILKIPSNKILLTGISSIDLFSTIYVGQHAIISTATQLPHHSLIMQICEQVSIYSPTNSLDLHLSEIENSSSTNESNQHDNTTELILVFCLQSYSPQQDCKIFKSFFTNTTHRLQHKSVYLCNCHTCGLSMNHTSIPNSAWNGMEDCLPYIAMSISEYLAFHCHKHVLFIWYELSSFKEFWKCGVVKGKNSGSLSALSVIENPNDDHSHKFVDVLNGVADCTIVLDRSLTNDCRQLYPPIKMEWGRFRIPARTTTSISFSEYWDPIRSIRKDVSFVRNVLLRLVHEAKEIHSQYAILAWDCVLLDDQIMMDFLTALELRVISQRRDEYRHLCETLNLVWKLLVEFFSLKCLKWKYPVPYSEEASLVDELYSSFAKLTKRRRILNMEIFQMNLFKKCQKGQFNDMILHAQR